MSLFDMFTRGATTVGAAQPQLPQGVNPAQLQPATPGNIPANAAVAAASTMTPGTAPNGAVPATTDVTGNSAKTGLEVFADLWNTTATPGQQGQPLFNTSPEKLMEAARKQNFSVEPTQEQMAAVAAGGPEAIKAMMEMMNGVAQTVYAQSAHATTRLIEGALDKSQFAKRDDIESTIRKSAVTSTLQETNPIFAHPVAAPMLQGLKDSLIVKYPNATPKELASMASSYLEEFTKAFQAPAQQAAAAAQSKASGTTDWSMFGV